MPPPRRDVPGAPDYFVARQAVYAVVRHRADAAGGLVRLLAAARGADALYATMVGLIVFVLAVGGATRGSRRWIEVPFFRFQPSELGKVLLVLALSAFVLDRVRRGSDREITSRVMLLALVPTLLVMAQPDLGTGIVYVTITLALLFVAGTKWTHFAALGGLAAVAAALVLVVAPAVGTPVLKGYQEDRLTAFLDKNDVDPQSQGYQLKQSEIAIGSGRKTGRGQRGRDSDPPRLPAREPHRLHLRGGRRTLRLRRRRDRPVVVRAADLALAADPHDLEEPVRRADCRRSGRHAHDTGVRERWR